MAIKSLSLALTLCAASALAEDRALIIGIDDYDAPLNGATADATRFAELASEHWGLGPAQVRLLTNDAATSDAILNALIDELVSQTKTGDTVLFYFAGKGTRLSDGAPALIAHDSDALLGKIPSSVIADILDLIADREVTLIIDAGFDGNPTQIGPTLTRGEPGALASDTAPFGAGKAPRTIWSAAASGQFAWGHVDRGVFTHALIDAIKLKTGDANGDDQITNAELKTHVTTQTQLWCDTTPACLAEGRGFTPVFQGDESAVVATKPVPIAVAPVINDPIIPEKNTPATYIETLGFVTDLFAPSNEATLTLAMSTGPAPNVGEIIEFEITADRPGQLVLLDVDPNGALAQVFPSSLAPNASTMITPDVPLVIPNGRSTSGQAIRIRVTEPAGQGFLLGLLIEGELPTLTAMLPENITGGPVPNAGQYLYEISQDLLALQATDANPVKWSATYLPYDIQP